MTPWSASALWRMSTHHLATVGAVMEQAAEVALGMKIPVDHEVVSFPSRYMDKRPGSQEMFDKAIGSAGLCRE